MVEVSRRVVLGAGVAAAGLVITGMPAVAEAAPARPRPHGAQRSDYSRLIGRRFTAVSGTSRRALTLVAIKNLPRASAAQRETCFNLIFEPVGTRSLPEGIYRLQRSGARSNDLFLSGVGTGRTVQALVNRAPAR